MLIEEQKNNLSNLLVSLYKARKAKGAIYFIGEDDGNPERISVSKSVLLKYGFDVNEEDFWEIICPLLKEDGLIKSYPDKFFFGLEDKLYENNSQYKKLRDELRTLDLKLPPSYSFAKSYTGKTTEEFLSSVVMLGSEKERVREIENEIEKVHRAVTLIEESAKENYVFIVDEKRILEIGKDLNGKKVKSQVKAGGRIKKIHILKRGNQEQSATKFYINDNYEIEYPLGRGFRWNGLYDIAQSGSYNGNNFKNIATYFNSTGKNPLYARYGFEMGKILKIEDFSVVANDGVEIKTITKQQLAKLKTN